MYPYTIPPYWLETWPLYKKVDNNTFWYEDIKKERANISAGKILGQKYWSIKKKLWKKKLIKNG